MCASDGCAHRVGVKAEGVMRRRVRREDMFWGDVTGRAQAPPGPIRANWAAAHAMARSLARVGEVELREMVSGLHMVASC